jgi:hypothetical protein
VPEVVRRSHGERDARTYLIFGDIEGTLDVLHLECTKCPRKGRYSVRKLIEKYGPSMHERCDFVCPDLPKVL